MPAQAPTTSAQALQEHLQKDAPEREASVARFMAFATGACLVVALALMPLIGARLSLGLAALLGALALYYGGLLKLIRGGWFHPAVAWLNVALEVSAPAAIFIADFAARGPEYALTAPPLAIWGTLVGLAALRGSTRLAVAAGALAGLEYLALYVFLAGPALGPDAPVTLQLPMVATRAFLLVCAGLVTATIAGHLNRRATEALAAMRARDVFGKYVLGTRIGAGGMAEVYTATYCPEGGFEKAVALKRVLSAYAEDDHFISMFRQEAALCSRLNHPNVVQVLDFGRFGDTYFLAMELVDGLTLRHLIKAVKGKGLPLPAVTQLGIELLSALDYVHGRTGPDGKPMNLVHRDVNPPNVLVSKLGEVKLSDFGIARASMVARVTRADTLKGKPGYLAPEQILGDDLDGRVDLFAAGATLHEALTGQHLFPTSFDDETLLHISESEARTPSAMGRAVPAALEAIVMGLLARDRNQRTQTAGQAVEALRALTGPAAALPDGQRLLAEAVREARALGSVSQVLTSPSEAATAAAR